MQCCENRSTEVRTWKRILYECFEQCGAKQPSLCLQALHRGRGAYGTAADQQLLPTAGTYTSPKFAEAESGALVGGWQAAARALAEMDGIPSPRPDCARPGRAAPGPRPQTGGAAGRRSPLRLRPAPLGPVDANTGAWPAAPVPAQAPAKPCKGGSGARGDARSGLHACGGAAAMQEQRRPSEALSGEDAAAALGDQAGVQAEHSAHAPRSRPARRTAERRALDFGVQARTRARTRLDRRALHAIQVCNMKAGRRRRARACFGGVVATGAQQESTGIHVCAALQRQLMHLSASTAAGRATYCNLFRAQRRTHTCWSRQVYARSPPPPPLPQCASPHGHAPVSEKARAPRRRNVERPATCPCDNACS